MKSFWKHAVTLAIAVLMALALPVMAQTSNDQEESQLLAEEELTQLLAPIALYPDELLAQVLIASTYPLEIVLADRWVQQNRELQGEALATALEKETWDPSVKSLVNFPSVLSMLSQKLDLTTKLGDAFLEQKKDVMDTVQLLRGKALAAGSLKSTAEQKVVTDGNSTVIEPANPKVIYVPSYDPYLVYGPWWYPDYPPFYFYPPPYPGSIYFSFGYGITLGLPWGYAWGWWDWYAHDIFITAGRNRYYNPYMGHRRNGRGDEPRGGRPGGEHSPWLHDPGHRRGVAYKGKETAREFGQLPGRRGVVRGDSRGFIAPGPGAEPRSPGQARPVSRGSSPKATRESVFTGGDGSRARRSSERGRRSIDRGVLIRTVPEARPRIRSNTDISPGKDNSFQGEPNRRPESGGAPGGFGGGPRGGGRGSSERR